MPLIKTDFPDLYIFEPQIYKDDRGYFFESYNKNTLSQLGVDLDFVQDNQARSTYGVVRGLHFQRPPYTQTKLVRVLEGKILDVVVDIRVGSPTYGKAYAIELSAENKRQLLVPKGFAHGYSVLTDTAEVFYKCDAFYGKGFEGGIIFDDPDLQIDWQVPRDKMILSEKDQIYPRLKDSVSPFTYSH